MTDGRRLVLSLVGGVAIWFVCILAFWAVRPLSDAVPVGVDYTGKVPARVSVSVACRGLFDSTARDDSPLPALKAQPKGSPPLGYQREPCGIVQRQARIVFALDTAVVLGAAACVTGLLVRRPRLHSTERLDRDEPVSGSLAV